MANIEQRAQVDIEVNSKSAQHKLAELGNKLDDLNKKKAAFEKAGDLKGMARMEGGAFHEPGADQRPKG